MKKLLHFSAILWVFRQPAGTPAEGKSEACALGSTQAAFAKALILLVVILCPAMLLGADVSLMWDANTEPDVLGYKVYYGTYSRTYGTPIDVGNTTSYTVRNLPAGTYYFAVTAYNSTQESGFSNEVSTVISAPDSTPPVISGVAANSITNSSAAISWVTNEAADSQVDYGTTTSFGNSTTLDASLITNHSQGISGLAAGTLYYFRVKSRDAAGNLSVSGNFTFTTAVSCSYTVSPLSQSVGASSGSGTLSVTTSGGCAWSASSNAAWITITAGTSGSGSGSVSYAVAANSTGITRTGTMTVAGQTVTISQQGSSCDVNSDSVANALDLQLLVNVILGITSCPGSCDVNRDGRIDALDLQTLGNVVLGVRSCP